MNTQQAVIAIDGYSSCGKSTLARALANKVHFIYVDSGAMYRATTLFFLRKKIALNDHSQLIKLLDKDIHITFEKNGQEMRIRLNAEDVSREIREMPVSKNVSNISSIPEVRRQMVKLQQQIGESENIVMDGRDIGTTVFPHASLKIFMTADPEIRAQRRFHELQEQNMKVSIDEIRANLLERDSQDTSRLDSPLKKAEDAIILDNSFFDQEQQLEFVLDLMRERKIIAI